MPDPLNLPNVSVAANDYAANSLAARDAKAAPADQTLNRLQDIDFDRNGKVDAAEVVAYFQADMTKVDTNGNNQLDPEEFNAFKVQLGNPQAFTSHAGESKAAYDADITKLIQVIGNGDQQMAGNIATALISGYQASAKPRGGMTYEDGSPVESQTRPPMIPAQADGLIQYIQEHKDDPAFMKALQAGANNRGRFLPPAMMKAAANAIDLLNPDKNVNQGVTGLMNTVKAANAARAKALQGNTPLAQALRLATTDRPGALASMASTPKAYWTTQANPKDTNDVTKSLADFQAAIKQDFQPLLTLCPDATGFIDKVRQAYPDATKGMSDANLTTVYNLMSGTGLTAANTKASGNGAIFQLQTFLNALDPTLGKQIQQNNGTIDDKYGYRTSDAFADFANRMTQRIGNDSYAGQFDVHFADGASLPSAGFRINNGMGSANNSGKTIQVQDGR